MPFTADELAALKARLAIASKQPDALAAIVVAVAQATMLHCERLIEQKTFPFGGVWNDQVTYAAGPS